MSATGTRTITGPAARASYRFYRRAGRTPRIGYAAMRRLFAADPGMLDDLARRAMREGALLSLNDDEPGLAAGKIPEIVAALRRDGYAVLPSRLDDAAIDELTSFARSVSCRLTGRASGAPTHASFDPSHPRAVRYDVDEADLLGVAAAQRLLADASLLAVAQGYLGAAPVQDLAAMWWSASVGAGSAAQNAAAQHFHFDLDRLGFVKIFVYLTDVTERTGPHSFVRGSHLGLPRAFRHDRRYDDDEVLERFVEDVIDLVGPRGTVFMADTRALHRGLALQEEYRLVFQLEYAVSLFGAPFSTPEIPNPTPELREAMRRFPSVYRRFRRYG